MCILPILYMYLYRKIICQSNGEFSNTLRKWEDTQKVFLTKRYLNYVYNHACNPIGIYYKTLKIVNLYIPKFR